MPLGRTTSRTNPRAATVVAEGQSMLYPSRQWMQWQTAKLRRGKMTRAEALNAIRVLESVSEGSNNKGRRSRVLRKLVEFLEGR